MFFAKKPHLATKLWGDRCSCSVWTANLLREWDLLVHFVRPLLSVVTHLNADHFLSFVTYWKNNQLIKAGVMKVNRRWFWNAINVRVFQNHLRLNFIAPALIRHTRTENNVCTLTQQSYLTATEIMYDGKVWIYCLVEMLWRLGFNFVIFVKDSCCK